jgi:hypothetical protein
VKKLGLRIAFLVLGSVMAVDRVGYAQVVLPPIISKVFEAATIPLNGATTLSFQITNPNPLVALTGVAFTDTLPSGLVVATPSGLTGSCDGIVTATAGASSISLSGGTLSPGAGAAPVACNIALFVTGTTAGVKDNSVTVTATEGGTGNTANASITVVAPPLFRKSFAAALVIPLNGTTGLVFTLINNNAVSLTGVGFVDTLPSGLVVATPNNLFNNCGGTATATEGSNTISLSDGAIGPSEFCGLIVYVTGTTEGYKQNTTGNVTSTEGGTGDAAFDSITVVSVPLSSFAVLGGSTVTNTNRTIVLGNLGVSPGSAVTGFPPGFMVGGTIHEADVVAAQAQTDLTTLYNNLANASCNTDLTGQNLGGLTLTPGVYCFSSSAQLTGTLTLNAQDNPAAVFVFQIGSMLTTASASSVLLINSASACGVFWQVGASAVLGTGTTLAGSIVALTSITLNTGTSVTGRALARNGAVTLDDNTVTVCSGGPPLPLPLPTNTPTNTPTSTPTPMPVVPTLNESGTLIFGLLVAAAGLLLLIRRR